MGAAPQAGCRASDVRRRRGNDLKGRTAVTSTETEVRELHQCVGDEPQMPFGGVNTVTSGSHPFPF
jgi:hypothetical protein